MTNSEAAPETGVPVLAEPAPIAETVADARVASDDNSDRILRQLAALDRAVYTAVAGSPTPDLDEPLRRLSDLATMSKLWIGVAGGIALVGGRTGRRAALTGLIGIGVTSAVVNQGIKRVAQRKRPDRADVPDARHVKMPTSTSFPSGHSASGFAFAAAVGTQLPLTGAGLHFLAATVAYSRVHTGVHYPGDVVIGSLIGQGVGSVVANVAMRIS